MDENFADGWRRIDTLNQLEIKLERRTGISQII